MGQGQGFLLFVGILLVGHICGLMGKIHILNVYAHYRDRDNFWQHLIETELLNLSSLVIAGDLNYTVGLHENWGCTRRVDFMAY